MPKNWNCDNTTKNAPKDTVKYAGPSHPVVGATSSLCHACWAHENRSCQSKGRSIALKSGPNLIGPKPKFTATKETNNGQED